jgi:hypothetical protein
VSNQNIINVYFDFAGINKFLRIKIKSKSICILILRVKINLYFYFAGINKFLRIKIKSKSKLILIRKIRIQIDFDFIFILGHLFIFGK